MTVDAGALMDLRITAGLPLELRERIAAALLPRHLAGGEWLFRQGDPGSELFLVGSGRLEVVRTRGSTTAVVGTVRAGDTLGELALLEGGTRAAGVRAVRDCDLHVLHRDQVAPLLADPHFAGAMLAAITRIIRSDPTPVDPAQRHPVIAVAGADPAAASHLLRDIADGLARGGLDVGVLHEQDVPNGPDGTQARTGRHLDRLEHDHDVVLLDARGIGDRWAEVCARQADRVVLLPDGSAAPPRDLPSALHGCDLVLAGAAPPTPAVLDRWAEVVAPRAHHRLRPGHHRPDVDRMARRLSGRALGLVLSGGGARGLAHIGVLQALEEAGLVIDRFGGTSMGAFISALAATGRRSSDIRAVAAREMVDRQPFRDYTVPRLGLIRGSRAVAMLQRVLGDADVRHLARSWFAVSADIGDAVPIVHRDGPVWEAAACSMSLPGLAPPRLWRDRVVVDGGVLDNLPVAAMLADEEGHVIAADVTRQRAFGGPDAMVLPGIVETLSATMVLSSQRQGERNRRLARVVIEPDVGGVDLLGFSQIDAAIAAGLDAGRTALAGTEGLLPRSGGG